MNDCGVKHQCADGKTGECRLAPGHAMRHLCRACLTFFDGENHRPTKLPPEGVTGTHPSMGSFLEIQNVAASSRGVQDAKVPHERFQVFGIWKATIATPYGAMVTELILQPNKDFSQTAVLNGLMTYDVGTVELGEGFIHFAVRDHQPKEYNGVRLKWLESFTYIYTAPDANTMNLEDRIAHSRWTVHRA
jgi:hypothetical protein